MALLTQPFLGLAPTTPTTVGGAAGATTVTFQSSVLGFPSVRVVNPGTAVAFIQFIDTTNTTTVGVTNAQPILSSSSIVLATGGKAAYALNAGGTNTVTIYVTAGQGGTAA